VGNPDLLQGLKRRTLPVAFYARDAREVARDLVGSFLVVTGNALDGGEAAAPQAFAAVRIVETEAYCGPDDGACHARFGRTPRTQALFGPPAFAYVFLIYGMHDCMNAVCGQEGGGHAVLLRAGEPVHGIAAGQRTDGPGRLSRAMGITRRFNGMSLRSDELFFAQGDSRRVQCSPRVGVGYAGAIAEEPWRFFDGESAHVSRPSPRTIGLGLTRTASS
jgi:DNA-3-methyladenine glycosylase